MKKKYTKHTYQIMRGCAGLSKGMRWILNRNILKMIHVHKQKKYSNCRGKEANTVDGTDNVDAGRQQKHIMKNINRVREMKHIKASDKKKKNMKKNKKLGDGL